jgi:tripartite-type tricarboxylate transporter receptor subunit TctC
MQMRMTGVVSRRSCFGLLGGALMTGASAGRAAAESYPDRAIRIISPHPVGVATDILGRALAENFSARFGQPVLVENRPKANGILAANDVAKAAPDGYTLHIASGAHTANAFVQKNLPYDVLKDFTPVTQVAASYGLALITNLPVNSVPELVALAKSRPNPLTYATNGVGNITHVAGLLFDARAGITMNAIPYNTPNLTTDVMTGQVDLAFYSVASAAPLVNGGKIKALAVTGSRRSPSLPYTPTLQELGYNDFDVTGWFGFLFPAGTPPDKVETIYRATKDAVGSPVLQRVFNVSGIYGVGSSPHEFAQFLKADYDYQDKLMTELGLKVR